MSCNSPDQLIFDQLVDTAEAAPPADVLPPKSTDLPDVSAAALAPMLRQYLEMKRLHPDHLILFQVGDFYELFFDDARTASDILGIRLTSRDKNAPEPTPMCGVPIHAIDTYLPRLLEAGVSCALISQVEDAKGKKGMVRREVTRIVTPGVRYEGDGLQEKQCNYLATAAVGPRGGGAVCYIDVSTGSLRIQEVESPETLVEVIERVRPAELLLPSTFQQVPVAQGEGWTRAVRARARELHCHIVLRPFVATSGPALQDLISSAPGAKAGERALGEQLLPESRSVVRAALEYIEELSFGKRPALAQIVLEEPEKVVFVDGATRANLELFESRSDGRRKNSLIDCIDYCRTAMGSRLLSDWLLSPSSDLEVIRARHEAVGEFVGEEAVTTTVRELLLGVRDLDRLVSRVTTGRAAPRDLRVLGDSLAQLEQLTPLLRDRRAGLLRELAEAWDPLTDLFQRIDAAVADDAPLRLNEGGIFKEGFHGPLDELRTIATKGKAWVLELEAKERERSGISSLRIKYNNVFGYFFEVTKTHLAKVPPYFERKQTLANAERFVTPELKELESTVLSARARQVDLERDLFVELREWVGAHASRIQATSRVLSQLDVLTGFARLARERGYCRPEMFDDNRLFISGGRHPVIERVIGEHNFIPNDTSLDAGNRRFALLTGPNMGGKSTYLRQVGIIQLLAQIGSFVPASSAQLGIVDRIFTRIGAADDITRGDSTFMVEMREAASIVKRATSKSLVLIDEIGRGTATADGLAIATAVAEWLHDKIGCRTIFATHFHELVEFATAKQGAICLCVGVLERDREIVFTHRIEERFADRSYGLEVARLAGLPEGLLRRAEEVLRQQIAHAEPGGASIVQEAAPQEAEPASSFAYLLPIADRLRKVSPDNMTPLQALQELHALRGLLEESE